ASINYYLKDTLAKSGKIAILNMKGDTIRKYYTPNKAGLSRLHWNLRHEPSKLPKLLTKPRDKDWVEHDKEGTRTVYPWDLDMQPGLNGPLIIPGEYKILFIADNKVHEQRVQVIKDPNMPNPVSDITRQYEFGLQLQNDLNTTIKMIEDIERHRLDIQKAIATEKSDEKKKEMSSLEDQFYQIESHLFDIRQTGARQDNFRNPVQILERFLAIGKELLVSSGDHLPTNQQIEVYQLTNQKLKSAQEQYNALIQSKVWKAFVGFKP
ncbi:MAG: glycosyl hydrolase, partial [Saprospiraceae bacterium]